MPPIESGDTAAVETPKKLTVSERLKQSEAERERLQRELDILSNTAFSDWLSATQNHANEIESFYNTLSWRVTKPLRVVRKVQLKAGEVGLARTSQVVVAELGRRVGRRR